MRTRIAALAVSLALLLAGCSTGASIGDPPRPAVGQSKPGTAGGAAADAVTGAGMAANRSVVSTGFLDVTVTDPVAAVRDAVSIVERAGGRIDARSEQPPNEFQQASAQITARIPSARLDATLEELKRLGVVSSLSLTATDVTQQTVDLDARIESLKSAVARLLELLAKATSSADLVAVETALSSRQMELESLQAQRLYLTDQINLATVTVGLSTKSPIPARGPTDFWGGVVAGWLALLSFLGATVIAVGVALPWLLVGVVLALLVLLPIRLARRRRSRPSPSPPAPSPPAPSPPAATPPAATET